MWERSIVKDQNSPMAFDYAVDLEENAEQAILGEEGCEAPWALLGLAFWN